MKNLILTSLLIVAIGFTSNATNNKSNTSNKTEENTSESTVTDASVESLNYTTSNLNYYNVIKNLDVDPFVKLIQLNDYNAVKNLINVGTDINMKTVGLTPLMYAARQNKVAIVKLLLDRGAKINSKSSHGYTALDYAKMSHATESYNLIEEAFKS